MGNNLLASGKVKRRKEKDEIRISYDVSEIQRTNNSDWPVLPRLLGTFILFAYSLIRVFAVCLNGI